jgi:hypothetical protein
MDHSEGGSSGQVYFPAGWMRTLPFHGVRHIGNPSMIKRCVRMKSVHFLAIAIAASLGVSETVIARQPARTRPITSSRVISPIGLGDLRIGKPVPRGSLWRARAAQEGGGCSTVRSPNYPGVYGMIIGGRVKRVTVGRRSNVKLADGIGVGATEHSVRNGVSRFHAEPHKYEPAPAKYMTASDATSGKSSIRLEIGTDRKVNMIHVGTMPELGYVEGCA